MVLLLPWTNFEYFKTYTNNSDPPLETNVMEENTFQPMQEVFHEMFLNMMFLNKQLFVNSSILCSMSL